MVKKKHNSDFFLSEKLFEEIKWTHKIGRPSVRDYNPIVMSYTHFPPCAIHLRPKCSRNAKKNSCFDSIHKNIETDQSSHSTKFHSIIFTFPYTYMYVICIYFITEI